MTLRTYATALYDYARSHPEENAAALLKRLKRVLEFRGHEKLFRPVIDAFLVRLEVGESERVELQVAKRSDAQKLSEGIKQALRELGAAPEDLLVHENKHLIGGFLIKKGSRQVDASHRRKLIKLYEQLISA